MTGVGNALVFTNFRGPIYIGEAVTAMMESSREMSRRVSNSFSKIRRSSQIIKLPEALEKNCSGDFTSDQFEYQIQNVLIDGPQSIEVIDSQMYVSSHKADESTGSGASSISVPEISMNYLASDMSEVPSDAPSLRLPSGASSMAFTDVSLNHHDLASDSEQPEQ